MGFKISNPIKSYSGVAKNLFKNPTKLENWKDAALTTGTGGWVQSDAADERARAEAAKKEAKANERALTSGKAEGYSEFEALTGMGKEKLRPRIQNIDQLLAQRVAQGGGDPISSAIAGQVQGATANAQRTAAQQGVKGGAALGALDTVARNNASQVAASLYGQQQQSIEDQRSFLGNMLQGNQEYAFNTAALKQKTPTPPKQESWINDLLSF